MIPNGRLCLFLVPLVALFAWCPSRGQAMIPRTPIHTRAPSTITTSAVTADRVRKPHRRMPQHRGPLNSCPAGCVCISEVEGNMVKCTMLTQVPQDIPQSATRLFIENSNLSLVEIRDLPNLEVLKLRGNSIKQLGFQQLPKLSVLDLSSNQMTNVLMKNTFRNLSQLGVLNLTDNSIDSLDDTSFEGLTNLTVLNLSSNQIKHIHRDSFGMLRNLESLDLSVSLITRLIPEWFQGASSLRVLLLRNNQINVLERGTFKPCVNLEMLDFSYNLLKTIEADVFAGLSKLKHLNLKGNYLRQLPQHLFSPLKALDTLDLSDNKFSMLGSMFLENQMLTVLHLNGLSNLNIIHEDTLEGLANLKELWMSNNPHLHFIHPLAFASLHSLQYVNLSRNNLTTLHQDLFLGLKGVKHLALDRNKWNCDCSLQWLSTWANQSLVATNEGAKCASPADYESESIFDFPWQELNCSNATITSQNKEVHSRIGATALLECQAAGNPPPSLTWVLPRNYVYHWYPPNVEGHWYIPYQHNHPIVHDRNHSHPGAHLVERIKILKNGNLYISRVRSIDAGIYLCLASNSLGNDTYKVTLSLNYQILVQVKLISILVGLATSIAALLLLLIFQLISMALNRWGCCCCEGVMSPKAKQIRKMLESVEQYKTQQLERLRDNYTMQVHKIKDNCTQQMERIRESYSTQVERLRDIRDFGTQQIDRVRDQYFEQVKRVRDYSFQQMNKVRENYIFQRNRIRKFSAHQLLRLRENYKLQQQHLNKILETLNIESCRTGCARTDSLVFNPDALMENVFMTSLPAMPPSLTDQGMGDGDRQLRYFPHLGAGSLVSSAEIQSSSSCPTTPTFHHGKPLAGIVKSLTMDPTVEDHRSSPFTIQFGNDFLDRQETSHDDTTIRTDPNDTPEDNHAAELTDIIRSLPGPSRGPDPIAVDVRISNVYNDSSKETPV